MNSSKKSLVVVLALALAAPVLAQTFTDGEIRRVDKEAKKLTIKHGPIPNLNMDGMTMVFGVRDPAMLDQVKAGDRIRFQANKIDGQYTVTKIEVAK